MRVLPNGVFLSHSNLDRDFVTEIAELLHRRGMAVWFGRTDIVGAKQWHDEIGAALKRCDWFVLFLSANSVRSDWVERELLFALNEHRYAERIIPVLIRPCDHDQLSWTLSSLQFFDFTGRFEDGCRSLLKVWGLGYRPPNP